MHSIDYEHVAKLIRNELTDADAAELLRDLLTSKIEDRWANGRRLDSCPVQPLLRRPGKYLDLALFETTSTNFCALSARLSHESWGRSLPETDKALLDRLVVSGDEHAKGLRWKQFAIMIEAPRYFWPELDTYVVGRIPCGSTSTMHKEARGLSGDKLVEFKSNLKEGTLQLRAFGASWHTLKRMCSQRRKHRLPE